MQVKVLVVDDSRFYRNRLCEILASDQDIKVVGTAENGKEAIDKTLSLMPDVITMDIEMPVMDGISAVREIMTKRPTPVLMFSSLTTDGAKATLDALEAGAVDFLMKRLDKLSFKNGQFAHDIRNRIITLGRRGVPLFAKRLPNAAKDTIKREVKYAPSIPERKHVFRSKTRLDNYKVLVIGASTGGPIAVQSIMSALPADYPVPILVVQHMPAAFTGPFAQRLDALSKLAVKEAEDGDVPRPGRGYIAPGGKQMYLERQRSKTVIRIRESLENELYKPSVDVTYQSVSEVYGNGALAIILTGMGTDGREGALSLKRKGSSVWAQDELTSVVFGMPQAVIEAGLADRVCPINELVHHLALGV
jgi:two-component system chemotaxis response regulator CheB